MRRSGVPGSPAGQTSYKFIGCQVITASNDIIKKLTLVGKEYSLETVKMV
jgi:hypothetical protein